MCYNRFTVQIDLFKYKRFKDEGCAYKNTGPSLKKSENIFTKRGLCMSVMCHV